LGYKFFIAVWLKRLALYRFDGIFSEFIGSIGKMTEAKYVSANFFKLLTNHKNSGIKDCTEWLHGAKRDSSAVPQNDECFFQEILAFARTIGTRNSNKIKNKNVMFGSLTTRLGERKC
jgi:hypothetical protein